LLEYPPVKGQQGKLDAANDAGVTDFRNEEALGPCKGSIWRSNPDMASKAKTDH